MFKITICLAVVFALTLVSELLNRVNVLSAEDRRKFFHISVGIFAASLPWIIGWQAIQFLSLAMMVAVSINRLHPVFKFAYHVRRRTYGEYFFGLALFLCAAITHNKLYFALAILNMALADGLAAVIGKTFGSAHKYKVFGQTKTVLGTMTFWLVSLFIFGIGLLFGHDYISLNQYLALIVFLPPLLALLENISIYGSDNFVVPIAVVLVLSAI